jgi:Holliday junction resolvasome RuvABC endonuclease subunit
MKITVAGLDPSLNNFGMVKGTLDLITGEFDLQHMALSQSETDKAAKKVVRKNSDDLRRAKTHTEALKSFLSDVSIVFVEIPVGSQSARAMASYGICIGVLSQITLPMIQVTPSEVKVAATGSKTATKDNMIKWAMDTYPGASWLTRKTKGVEIPVSKNEHLADATAIHAGVMTQEFATARLFFK